MTEVDYDKLKQSLYDELVEIIEKYHPSKDLSLIKRAYELADEAHKDQRRKSGEPYITHPVSVAIILAKLELDKESIIAAILHDVVEDTKYTTEDIVEIFGQEIADLVDGVTKLTAISYTNDKELIQAENYRKMFLAMSKDIRVILIKLADRLHNMRTLEYMTEKKQREKARETLDIYAPLANRLGISKLKVELEDLSLQYLYPKEYQELLDRIAERKEARMEKVDRIVAEVKKALDDANIKAEVSGRPKHLFSIYKKMVSQGKDLDQIFDLYAVRAIVDSVKDCYGVLGVIHELFKPIPGRFKDYIAMPKTNMYQSLHTTLIADDGYPFELQIRTKDMHRTSEYGIAAHWRYKEGSKLSTKDAIEQNANEKLNWLKQILEWQKDMSDNREFMNALKTDLDVYTERVYAFTPNGDIVNLPRGSSPIDFAYSIHSAVGNKMIGARVNGKIVTYDYEIRNGDRVDIITSGNSKGPSLDWLKLVKSSQARSKINQWFRKQNKEDNIIKGKEMIDRYVKIKGYNPSDIFVKEYMEKVQSKYGFHNWDAICAAIGHGGLKEGQVVNRLYEHFEKNVKANMSEKELIDEILIDKKEKPKHSKTGIVVKGVADLAVRFSKCCNPLPGDEIVGFITKGRGVSIHRTDCVNMIYLNEVERHRLIDAEWSIDEKMAKKTYRCDIQIIGRDRERLLFDVSKVLTEESVDIISLAVKKAKDKAIFNVSIDIGNHQQLMTIMNKIQAVESVEDILRKNN